RPAVYRDSKRTQFLFRQAKTRTVVVLQFETQENQSLQASGHELRRARRSQGKREFEFRPSIRSSADTEATRRCEPLSCPSTRSQRSSCCKRRRRIRDRRRMRTRSICRQATTADLKHPWRFL